MGSGALSHCAALIPTFIAAAFCINNYYKLVGGGAPISFEAMT